MAWAPDYATLTELKNYLRITTADDDAVLGFAITASSRAIDRHCNRQFGNLTAVEDRRYTARFDKCRNRWVVDIDDLMDQTGLVITVEGGTVDQFTLQPSNAAEVGEPYTRIIVKPESTAHPTFKEDDVVIDAKWGWTAVPTAIKQATLLQASRLFARRGAPFGVAGSPDMGSEMRLLAKVDPDVAVVLGKYLRWWAAA